MTNTKIIKSILNAHSIKEVIIIEKNDSFTFLIKEMNECIPLERWNNLENILIEHLKKDVILLPLSQAIKHLGKDFLKKGEII